MATRRVAVFLDFDGTLTPIAEHPEQAVLSAELRGILTRLAERAPVAVVSGRDREDVARRVGLANLIFAGNHGFDIQGPPGSGLCHKEALPGRATLDDTAATLTTALKAIDGTLIERKTASVAVHYRAVRPDDVPAVCDAIETVLAMHPALRRMDGKKVIELMPERDWDKGSAVHWICERQGWLSKDWLPLYLGDDITDEDAFLAIRDSGIGIVVGADDCDETERPTAARYRLADPAAVQVFLTTLSEALA